MPSPVSSNVPSLTAQHNLDRVGRAVASSFEKLSTGLRINRGSDDPAGLITSENLRAQLAELEAESRGLERTDAVANVADGALAEVSELLIDANGAAVAQANTAGISDAEREAYQLEIDSARQSVERIVNTTTFNGKRVLDGNLTLSAPGAGADASVAVERVAVADSSQAAIQDALSQVATLRGQIGAFQKNTIGSQLRSNATEFENTSAANSAIRDTDYAEESSRLIRARVIQASTVASLALANSAPRSVLDILS